MPFNRPHNPSRQGAATRRAFALLMVLMVLGILAAMTATMAYAVSSRSLAVDARAAVAQNRLVIDAAMDLLSSAWPSGELRAELLEQGHARGRITLGDHLVEYRIWDEATKLRITPDASGTLQLPPSIKGASMRPSTIGDGLPSSFYLFEEVFEVGLNDLGRFYGGLDEEPSVADAVTLWGDGRVNLFTATEDVIRLRLSGQSGVMVESVIAARRYGRTSDLDRLIGVMGLSPHDSRIVGARLTSGVSTITLRLACHGPLLRSDGFAVVDVRGDRPRLILWRDLPPGHDGPQPRDERAWREW